MRDPEGSTSEFWRALQSLSNVTEAAGLTGVSLQDKGVFFLSFCYSQTNQKNNIPLWKFRLCERYYLPT